MLTLSRTKRVLPNQEEHYMHGIFREDTYTLCGIDYSSSVEFPIPCDSKITCKLCVDILKELNPDLARLYVAGGE